MKHVGHSVAGLTEEIAQRVQKTDEEPVERTFKSSEGVTLILLGKHAEQ